VVANKQHYLLQALSSQQWSLASEILDSPILQINQPTFLLEQALHLAIRFGAKNIARGLLERGAEIYWQDNEGVDAYMVAAGLDISQRYMITLLLEYAPVDMTRADNNGQTVVHYACGCVDRDDIVGMALAQGASLETPNNRDMTPLQIALREGAVRCAEKLLAAGVSYRRFQNLKRRYEHYDDSDDDDILLENLDFPNVLYQIDALGRHGTAHDLLAAVIAKRAAVVNLLLSTDCQKPLLPQGETLMMLAARQGDITTLKILSRFEAGSLEIINSDGQTALDVALSHGHQECWMYLRELSSRQILFTQRAVEGEQSKADLRLF
jgi:ankyrin repeat protein